MATGAVSSGRDPQRDMRWKWLLLVLCSLTGFLVIAGVFDNFGVGGSPLLGWWDASEGPSTHAYVYGLYDPVPGGAAASAGIRDGDLIDLREQTFEARVRWAAEPLAGEPLRLIVHRAGRTFATNIVGSTVWDGKSSAKIFSQILLYLSAAWFFAFATIIAWKRWRLLEARLLALAMLCASTSIVLTGAVVPSASLQLAMLLLSYVLGLLEVFLLVGLSARYGERSRWRLVLECLAYAANTVNFIPGALVVLGIATTLVDPMPYSYGTFWLYFNAIAAATVALCAVAAVVTSAQTHRVRIAWLLLPIPLVLCATTIIVSIESIVTSWIWAQALSIASGLCAFLGGLCVTYAMLKRRVLDFGFILSRAVVVSVVGLIVVVAFVLLEWMLGSVLTGVSHATGLIANAALALVIGVSLSYVHKRVDQSVDLVLFRKRHEDEKALLGFAKEAAYITECDALLDATLEKVRRHTDARSASVLIGANGFYSVVQSFGDKTVVSVNENDEAVLALKVWHKPIDPHHYETALHAALALPMLSRGKLYGVLILGERAGGEAYAPDEVDALSQLANGVGSALEALSLTTDGSASDLAERVELAIASMRESLAAEICSEIRALRTSSST